MCVKGTWSGSPWDSMVCTFGAESLAPPSNWKMYRSLVIVKFRFGRSRGERRYGALVCSGLRSVQIKGKSLEAQQNSALWVPDFGGTGPIALVSRTGLLA